MKIRWSRLELLLTALAEPRVKVAIEWYLIEMLDVFEWGEWQFGKFRGRNRKGFDLLGCVFDADPRNAVKLFLIGYRFFHNSRRNHIRLNGLLR